jgi:hypothetical protein
MRIPGVRAVGVSASQDSVGEPAIVLFVSKGALPTKIPQEVDGVRTRIVEGEAPTRAPVRTTEQPATLDPAAATSPAAYSISESEFARVKAVHKAHVDEWMSKAGVQGVGIGASADAPGEAAIIFFLIRGVAHEAIPATLDGVRTRVRESSPFVAGLRDQPAMIGCVMPKDRTTKRQ